MLTKKIHLFTVLLLSAVGILLHIPLFGSFFLSDDFIFLQYAQNFSFPDTKFFRPFARFLLQMQYIIFQLNHFGYFFISIIAYTCSGVLLYLISINITNKMDLLDVQSKYIFSLAISLFFLTYPYNNESVAWISGQASLFSSLCAIISLFLYTKIDSKNCISGKLLFSLFFFLCSLLFYESTWVFPIIIVFLDLLSKKLSKQEYSHPFRFQYYLLIFGVYLLLRLVSIREIIGCYGVERHINLNILIMYDYFVNFLSRSVIPPMSDYPLFLKIFKYIILFFVVSYIFFYNKNKRLWNMHFVFLIIFFISLIPVLSLGISLVDSESERFLLFPSVFLSFVIITFIFAILNKLILLKYTVIVVVLVCNVYFLQKSHKNWRSASNIAKQAIEIINQNETKSVLICLDLPEKIDGAFIFRNGFPSAIELFTNKQFEQIHIKSRLVLNYFDNNIEKYNRNSLTLTTGINVFFGCSIVEVQYTNFEVERYSLDETSFLIYTKNSGFKLLSDKSVSFFE
jgi:hypothetical protein